MYHVCRFFFFPFHTFLICVYHLSSMTAQNKKVIEGPGWRQPSLCLVHLNKFSRWGFRGCTRCERWSFCVPSKRGRQGWLMPCFPAGPVLIGVCSTEDPMRSAGIAIIGLWCLGLSPGLWETLVLLEICKWWERNVENWPTFTPLNDENLLYPNVENRSYHPILSRNLYFK